ncbi:hypothetical protein AAVH_16171 [Aphelenchoides avenae]|nr:hypothetical protein AAVH_16171 [Aphelenchus avenae]
MSRPQSNILEYIINLSTDVAGRKIELRDEDPCEVLRRAFQTCESCAIQSLDLNFLELTADTMSVFTEFLPKIPVYYVRLYDLWNGVGGTMDDLLTIMRGLTVADLRPDPTEQATDGTLRICREIGVSMVYVCAADLMSESSAISEDGIFDFCFGAEVHASYGSVRKLDVDRPHLTPQFMGRLISMNMKSSSTTPLILKIKTDVVFETSAFRPVPCDRHPGLCYRFDDDIPFQLHWDTVHGSIELRRGTEVDDHTAQPRETESDSDDD